MPERVEQQFGKFKDEVESASKSAQYFVTPFLSVISTNEEVEKLSSIMADIETCQKEMVTKFILGQTPLSEFYKYIQNMKDMGIDIVIAIKQAQYDRYIKK